MKAHYIVKNGERQTGEMSVFEAVESTKQILQLWRLSTTAKSLPDTAKIISETVLS